MAYVKIQPPGVVPVLDEDRQAVIKVISGDTWTVNVNLFNPRDQDEPATPENTLVRVVLSETQFENPIWEGSWYEGVYPDPVRKDLCQIRIPRKVTKNLRRGSYLFSLRASDLLMASYTTEIQGSFIVEYAPSSDQHSIPYKDETSGDAAGTTGTVSNIEAKLEENVARLNARIDAKLNKTDVVSPSADSKAGQAADAKAVRAEMDSLQELANQAATDASAAVEAISETRDALANVKATAEDALSAAASLESTKADQSEFDELAAKVDTKAGQSALDAHVNNKSNPHSVTASQIGGVPLVEDASGEKTAVTIGSRKSGVPVGEGSFANGDGLVAFGIGSHAEGESTVANGSYSHTEGESTYALAKHSHTSGLLSETRHNDDYAFAWNGDRSISERYQSHGSGTFNINPAGGLDGFYIGEQTLYAIMSDKAGKAAPSAAGNLAALTADGDLEDSGKTVGDFLPRVSDEPVRSTFDVNGPLFLDMDGYIQLNSAGFIYGSFNNIREAGDSPISLRTELDSKVDSFESVGGASATVEDGVAKLYAFFTKSNGLLTATIDNRLPIPISAKSEGFTTESYKRFIVAVSGDMTVTLHTPTSGDAEIFECRFNGASLSADASITFAGATATTMDTNCGTVTAGKVALMSAFWNGATWDINWKVEG